MAQSRRSAAPKKGGTQPPKGPRQAPKPAAAPKKPRKPYARKLSDPPTPWQQWSADEQRAIDHLCADIVQGGNLWAYSQTNGISYGSLRNWLAARPEFEAKYARAREDRSDKLADEIVAISDEAEVRIRQDEDGQTVLTLDAAAIARNRLRVDARKWVASKLKPRVYGDKVAVGGDPDAPPIQHSMALRFVEPGSA